MARHSIHALHSLIIGPIQLAGELFNLLGRSTNSVAVAGTTLKIKNTPNKLQRAKNQ